MSKMNKFKPYFVKPGSPLDLSHIDPDDTGKYHSKKKALKNIKKHCALMAQLQATLYAEKKQSLLIVLQALDAGGKDGTVNHVFSAFNPQGTRVAGFKQPTPEELAHDFLWRIHARTPGKGEIVIFNRSHYEDVLVTRVHNLVDQKTCDVRYKRIREFEELLIENGTRIVKFFLHISPEEQLARFAQRLKDPARNWKISNSDYSERELWPKYISAFENALAATSTEAAPWYVIPANNKWYRNLLVSQIITATMKSMHMAFPAPTVDLEQIRKEYHQAAEEEKKADKKD